MNTTGKHLAATTPDPFDGSARARLERVRLIDDEGQLDQTAMDAFADIFTGLFYDDQCEYYDTAEDVLTIFKTFKALYSRGSFHHMYLLMSIQYDFMRKPLPDPIWWIAGNSAAIKAFMTLFMERYERLLCYGDAEPREEAPAT